MDAPFPFSKMAPHTRTHITIHILLFSSILFHSNESSPSDPVDPTTACHVTPDPTFCRSILPPGGSCSLYSYGRFSLAKSLSSAYRILTFVDRYLSDTATSQLSPTAIGALRDCRLLSALNINFLTSTISALNNNTNALVDATAETVQTVQTLLSALLSNHQTCYDGLQAAAPSWSAQTAVAAPMFNSSRLYSVSLALFTKAWNPECRGGRYRGEFTPPRVPNPPPGGRRGRRLLFHESEMGPHGELPLLHMSASSEEFKRRLGRRLLQAGESRGAVLIADVVTVSQDGSGNYTTIGAAVAAAPTNLDGSTGYYLMNVVAGVYQEYVSIPSNKRYLMMVGDGINQTVITGNRSVGDRWTTFSSATFAVLGQGFVGVGMTIRNTAGAAKGQAAALRNGADLSTFYSCSIEGYQDTLYVHSMRQFFRECDIYGTIDFIFGNAAVVFQKCNIYARRPLRGQGNTITAQARSDPNQNTGTSMQGCRFVAAPELAAAGGSVPTFLGRPWEAYSRTVIMQSFMDKLIDPQGWGTWSGNFGLSTLYYAEYQNNGPGSRTSGRVKWPEYHEISSVDARNFTASNFILGDNWLPQTGVAYSSGLL